MTMNSVPRVDFQDDTLFIQGDVNFHSVSGLMQQLDKLALEKPLRLDCSGMTHVDSVAVSLLLHLLQGRDVVLQGVGDSLQGLLNLYGVAVFFNNTQGI